jgi:hypothetical protein
MPKVAGTSFQDCLERIYPGRSFNFSGDFPKDLERYNQIPCSDRTEITLYAGHAARITGIAEVDNLPTITLLREPIARVKSFCQHVSEGKSPYLLKAFPPAHFDLDAFLNSNIHELTNLQTRMLVGNPGYDLPAFDQATLVELAVEVLEHKIGAFGIFENFDASLLLFRRNLGWQEYPIYRKLNVRNTARLIAFQRAHIDQIREMNEMDIQVYQRAYALFDRQIRALSDGFEQEREFLQQAQKHSRLFWAIQRIRRRARCRYEEKTIPLFDE